MGRSAASRRRRPSGRPASNRRARARHSRARGPRGPRRRREPSSRLRPPPDGGVGGGRLPRRVFERAARAGCPPGRCGVRAVARPGREGRGGSTSVRAGLGPVPVQAQPRSQGAARRPFQVGGAARTAPRPARRVRRLPRSVRSRSSRTSRGLGVLGRHGGGTAGAGRRRRHCGLRGRGRGRPDVVQDRAAGRVKQTVAVARVVRLLRNRTSGHGVTGPQKRSRFAADDGRTLPASSLSNSTRTSFVSAAFTIPAFARASRSGARGPA